MIFSHSVQYAIKSCIYLARKNEKTDVVEIAEFIGSPIPFTSKTLQKLVRKNVISSAKGRFGGFYLNETQYENLTISDIYFAIEETNSIDQCALGLKECSAKNPCPIHEVNVQIKKEFARILDYKIKTIKDSGQIVL